MKRLNVQQNSEEWLEFRKGKSGGSQFKDIYIAGLPLKSKIVEKLEEYQPLPPADKKLTTAELAGMLEPSELVALKLESDPKKRYYEIVAERVARPVTPNDYVGELNGEPFSWMARGHILEPMAIKAWEDKTGKKIDQTSEVWISDYSENAYVSPDGSITDKNGKVTEALEVKCLSSPEVVKAYLTNHYPEEYESQVLKYFMVNDDLQVLHFIIYTDLIPGLELQVFEITREDIENQIEEARIFEKAILERIDVDTKRIEELSF